MYFIYILYIIILFDAIRYLVIQSVGVTGTNLSSRKKFSRRKLKEVLIGSHIFAQVFIKYK